MSWLNFLFYLLFTIIFIIIIFCFLLNRVVNKGLLFALWQRIYLGFLLSHSFYILGIHVVDYENSFFSIIAPLSLFYAPFYFSALYVLVPTDVFKFSRIFKHFYISIFFTVLYWVIVVFYREDINLQLWYKNIMYSVAVFQFLFYAIISFTEYNKFSVNSLVTSSMSQSLTFLIITSFLFAGLLIGDPNQISNEFNELFVYMMILCAVVILFRYNLIVMVRIINKSGKELDMSGVRQVESKVSFSLTEDPTNDNDVGSNTKVKEKYEKSRIKEEEIKKYVEKVEKALEEKIYLDSELTLEKLSITLKIPKYHLTQVFSLGFNSGFSKLINQYRVEYAISLLNNSSNNLTIEEIGAKSGFSSRSSFYRTFNMLYKISPTDYRNKKLK